MKVVVAGVLAVFCLFLSPHPVVADDYPNCDLEIWAWIDGVDDLVFTPTQIYWYHEAYDLPGVHQMNPPAPTTLSGYNWYPEWDSPGYVKNISSHPLPARIQTNGVWLEVLSNRGVLKITQYPSAANGNTMIVHIDDDEPAGAAWYGFKLHNAMFTLGGESDDASLACPLDHAFKTGPMIGQVADLDHQNPIIGAIGDVNGDGQDDFLSVGRCKAAGIIESYAAVRSGVDGGVIIPQLAMADGAASPTLSSTLAVSFASGLRADFTGDGVPEFAVGTQGNCSTSHGGLAVYDGATGEKIYHFAPGVGCAGYSAAAGDVDGDHIPDLVIGDPGQNKLFVLPSNGGGTALTLRGRCSGSIFGGSCPAGSSPTFHLDAATPVSFSFTAAASNCSSVALTLSIAEHGRVRTKSVRPRATVSGINFGTLPAGDYTVNIGGQLSAGALCGQWSGALTLNGGGKLRVAELGRRVPAAIDPTLSPPASAGGYSEYFNGGEFCWMIQIPGLPSPCVTGAASPLVAFGTSVAVLEDHSGANPSTIVASDPRHAWQAGGPNGGGLIVALRPPKYSRFGPEVPDIIKLQPDLDKGYLGYGLQNLGDLNNDKFDDLLIAAPGAQSPITLTSGTMVWSGSTLKNLRFQTPAGGYGEASSFDGYTDGSQFGYSLGGRQDIDADGHDDLIISSPGEEDDAQKAAWGAVRVYSGVDKRLLFELGNTDASNATPGQRFGESIAALNRGRLVVADQSGMVFLYGLGADGDKNGVADRCEAGAAGSASSEIMGVIYKLGMLTDQLIFALKSMPLLQQNKNLPSSVQALVGLDQDSLDANTQTAAAANWRAKQLEGLRTYIGVNIVPLRQLLTDNQPELGRYHKNLVPAQVARLNGRYDSWNAVTVSSAKGITKKRWKRIAEETALFIRLLSKIKAGATPKKSGAT